MGKIEKIGLGRLRHSNVSSPACTFKISRYAANHQYSYSLWNQCPRMKTKTWSRRGWRECILKIVFARGAVQFSYVIFFFWGGGEVFIHHTFLKTPTLPFPRSPGLKLAPEQGKIAQWQNWADFHKRANILTIFHLNFTKQISNNF